MCMLCNESLLVGQIKNIGLLPLFIFYLFILVVTAESFTNEEFHEWGSMESRCYKILVFLGLSFWLSRLVGWVSIGVIQLYREKKYIASLAWRPVSAQARKPAWADTSCNLRKIQNLNFLNMMLNVFSWRFLV